MGTTQQVVKRNRFFGVLIIAIIIAPMALAYMMYHTGWGVSSHTTNKGALLTPPVNVQALTLHNNSDTLSALFANANANKKWRFLIPVSANCQEACQKNLYTSRQVHIRLAEKAYRVERILLLLDDLPASLLEQLTKEHPNTLRVLSTQRDFMLWLANTSAKHGVEQHYYLVDQEGFAMMQYGVQHSGQDLLDDIKKLLKFTYDK